MFTKIRDFATHPKLPERAVAVTAVVGLAFSFLSLVSSYVALQKADNAILLQSLSAKEQNLNRIEEIYLENVPVIEAQYHVTTAGFSEEHTRLRQSLRSTVRAVERIKAVAPVFYDKYLSDYSQRLKAMDDRMSTATFRHALREQLKGDAYKLVQKENTEMLDLANDFQSHLFSSMRKEREELSTNLYSH